MKIHDISMTLHDGMLTYPKDVPYRRSLQRDMHRGDSSNVSYFETTAHVGTHIDAPRHYLPDGCGADRVPLESLYGPAWVADCRGVAEVNADLLAATVPDGTRRLLLKTDNSLRLRDRPDGPFDPRFVYLTADGAEFCVQRGVKLVGIDYLSIDQSGLAAKSAHHVLLENGIVILEGILLAEVPPGGYFLACGILKMADADGAPARAVLIEGLEPGESLA